MNNKVSRLSLSLSLSYQNRKEERTGLNPVASPLTLSKGGQRHSETIRGLSDSIMGVTS